MRKNFAAFAAVLALSCPALATLTTTTNSASYVGNGSTTAFTVPFKFLANADLVVTVAGVPKTLGSDYSVKGAGAATGTVTMASAPASGAAVVITRAVPFTQPTSLRQSRSFDPAVLENALDRTTMQIQRLSGTAASATSSGLLSATDWIRFNTIATNQVVASINTLGGINDPSATLTVLENGRVSQLPYIEPYEWFRMDQFTGARASTALVGERNQTAPTFTRATTGTVVVKGVESTAAAGQYRFQDNPPGLLIEQSRQNYISTPDAPVSQLGLNLSLAGTRAYYLRVEGTGSLTLALSSGSTGTATGLPCTATASSPCSFVMTAPGTVDTTVTGSLTFAQLEQGGGAAPTGIAPTSRIHTATTRNADQVAIAGVLRNGRDWIVSIKAQPNGGLAWKGNDDRGLFSIGDTNGAANSAQGWVAGSDGFMRFAVYDNAAVVKQINVPSVSLGNIEHDFWFYNTADGAKIEAWVDGVQVAPTSITGTGAGFITTMPTNFRPGTAIFSYLNGVVKEAKIYYDTAPERLPQPQWTRTITPNTVACIGDSITFGTGGAPTPYPSVLQTTLSGGATGAWTVLNAGVGGDQTWQTLRRWGAGVRRQTQKYVVLLSGTNDLANTLPAQIAWNNLTRIATQVRVDGKQLVLITILPRTTLNTAMNTERVALNVLIKAYCAAGNATCVDADPVFDNGDGRTLKVAYDSGDGIHPNQAGYNQLAAMVAAVIPH